MTRTTRITGMTAALAMFAAIAMAFTPAAVAGEKANKDTSAQTAPPAASDRTEPHGGIMTEKLGKEVPTMTAPDDETKSKDAEMKAKDGEKKTKTE